MHLPWQDFDKKQQRALTIAVIIALAFGAYFLRRYFLLIVVAAILVYLFNPINKRFLKHGRKKGTASVLTFLVMLVVLLIPITLIMIATVAQVRGLIHDFSANSATYNIGAFGHSALASINRVLDSLGAPEISQAQAQQAIANAVQTVGKQFIDIVTGTVASIPELVTRGILFIYVFLGLMVYQDKVLDTLQKLNPLGRKVGDLYLAKTGAMTKAMAKGQLVIAFCDGLTDATLMYIAGFHSIFFFMLILLTFLSFIPLGGGIIVIPLGIVLVATGHIWQGLLLVLGHILITSNIDNVLRPRFVPKDAYLQPALTMLSVFSGVAMFGILGVIVGPIIMILIVSTIQVYLAATNKPVKD